MGLDALLAQVHACRICIGAAKPLPHEPRPVLQPGPKARILIAGQAPGLRVHASGRPFTDPSGVRLREWLGVTEAIFYDPREVAILPMGFCFPGLDAKGSDLPPRPECAPAWRAKLLAAMPKIELVVCLGSYAMRWHMGRAWPGSVDAAVRNWRVGLALTPAVIPLPHPSWRNSGWLKRNPWFAADLLPELQARVARLLAPRA
ncbi:MAG: uracil-DNA glycosylase family protein [Aestuariivirga sp.]|uniref:uracil-DNA glycosylase family protein n=1 Tax=Aestuariivirga sp. TaxID=2650926 RepID=UPI0030167F27